MDKELLKALMEYVEYEAQYQASVASVEWPNANPPYDNSYRERVFAAFILSQGSGT